MSNIDNVIGAFPSELKLETIMVFHLTMSPTLKKVVWNGLVKVVFFCAWLRPVPLSEHWLRDRACPTSSKFLAINSEFFFHLLNVVKRSQSVLRWEFRQLGDADGFHEQEKERGQVSDPVLSFKRSMPSARNDLPRSEIISKGCPICPHEFHTEKRETQIRSCL
ncbi:hypothetical protein BASA83_013483 [Batrachochytrium salamandrivorans]|nr:hypothetical protein BASA83_013483 [Batrachochytrium salamandrivorans]